VEYDYRCHAAGARPCSFRTQSSNEKEAREQIVQHLIKVHDVAKPTATIVNYLVGTAQGKYPSWL
jgi:predicted small metal-binding protein